MKYSIALLLSLSACQQAMAVEDGQFENCNRIAGLAEQIMNTRQKGVPADKAYEVFNKEPNKEKRDFLMGMVTSAYQIPRYSVEENKRQAIADFKDRTLVDCMK